MKITTTTLIIGLIVAALGVVGLLSGDTIIAGGMNTDFILDVTRLGLGALLVFGGLKSADASRTVLSLFGVAYLGMFVLGIMSPTLFGLLPNGLGWMDQTLHIIGGIGALFIAMAGNKNRAVI
jgi:hypothetical protein